MKVACGRQEDVNWMILRQMKLTPSADAIISLILPYL